MAAATEASSRAANPRLIKRLVRGSRRCRRRAAPANSQVGFVMESSAIQMSALTRAEETGACGINSKPENSAANDA
jgi:hypothetical protein